MKRLIIASLAILLSAQAFAKDYLVISNGNKFGKNFSKDVAKAGGTVGMKLDQIGVARVSAADGFSLANATVVEDIKVNMHYPTESIAVEIDAANPPSSGDDDVFFDLQWGHDAVNAPEAWENGSRGQGATVAVLDGGFDLDHPDLMPNINYGLSVDFTGEGLAYGLLDPFSHGSHVAGTIAAADNAFGTIGVAPEAELVLVKVLGDAGTGSFGDVMAGIIYAGLVGVDVINMSLGAYIPQGTGIGSNQVAALRAAMNRAVSFAHQRGATVIVAAGNDASDLDKDKSAVVFPADMPHAISISATAPSNWAIDPSTTLDDLASYSNYGRSGIDFAAPGGDFDAPGNDSCTISIVTRPCWVFDFVFSTGNGGWYWSVGTSMAAPHAAGIAALIIAENGGSMHPSKVKTAMKKRSDDLGQRGNDPVYGAGRVSSGY